jgi:capsular exopolysaccharide synthesis family protein
MDRDPTRSGGDVVAEEWNAQSTVDLRRYGRILWRRKLLVALVTAAFALAGFVAAGDDTVKAYVSSAEVLVKPITANPLQGPSRVDQAVDLETEGRILESTAVAQLAAAKLATADSPETLTERVTTAVSPDTQILRVSYRAEDAAAAQAGAQAFADAYLEYKTNEAVNAVRAVTDRIQANIGDLDGQMKAANATMAANLPDSPAYTQAQGSRDVLIAQIAQLRNQIATYTAVDIVPGAVIRPAGTSTPQRSRRLPVPLVAGLGLLAGMALAVVRDRFDDRLHSADEIREAAGLPLLASVPRRRGARRRERIVRPYTPDAEAYQRLASNVAAAASTTGARRIVVTSASAGEGKSTVAANMATALARTKRVALVSADLRLPTLHEFFTCDAAASLNDLLEGRVTAPDVAASPQRNLDIYASRPTTGHPAQELQSPAMRQLLDQLGETHDVVILDAPPILPVADTLPLAAAADATILVVHEGATTGAALHHTTEQLVQVGTRLLGVVVNQAARTRGSRDYYRAPEASRRREHWTRLRRVADADADFVDLAERLAPRDDQWQDPVPESVKVAPVSGTNRQS